MNLLYSSLILLAAAGVIFAEDIGTLENAPPLGRRIVHEVNLNKAFDKSLSNIQNLITKKGMDPMEIPDVEIPLSHLPGLLKTKMILHKGVIQQLSTIYRTGDIIMQYSTKKVSLYLNVGWETLDLSHEYSLRYMLFTRKGNCFGRYHDVKSSILVEFDLTTRKIDLKFFKFIDVGKFDIKLEGHLIDGLLNIISTAVTKVFRTTVLRTIEAKAYEEIDKAVQEINDLIPSPMDYFVVMKEVGEDYDFMNAGPYEIDGLGQM